MDQQDRAHDYASHIATYESFIYGVRIILGGTAVILLLLAYFLI